MAQVPQDVVNRRVRDPQIREILDKKFQNEERAVYIAEITEDIMSVFMDQINSRFTDLENKVDEVAKEETVAKDKTVRELIDLVTKQGSLK